MVRGGVVTVVVRQWVVGGGGRRKGGGGVVCQAGVKCGIVPITTITASIHNGRKVKM